jgi:hypothetical protein
MCESIANSFAVEDLSLQPAVNLDDPRLVKMLLRAQANPNCTVGFEQASGTNQKRTEHENIRERQQRVQARCGQQRTASRFGRIGQKKWIYLVHTTAVRAFGGLPSGTYRRRSEALPDKTM